MKSGKVVVGVLAGMAVGALIGIVFAPQKGSKLRKGIVDKGEDYLGDLKEKFNGFLANVTDKYDTTRHEAEELASRGKAKYEEVKRELKSNNS
jgi:gas vesicle protein